MFAIKAAGGGRIALDVEYEDSVCEGGGSSFETSWMDKDGTTVVFAKRAAPSCADPLPEARKWRGWVDFWKETAGMPVQTRPKSRNIKPARAAAGGPRSLPVLELPTIKGAPETAAKPPLAPPHARPGPSRTRIRVPELITGSARFWRCQKHF